MDAILSDQYSRDDPAGQLAAAGFSAGRVGMGRSDDATPGVRIERDERRRRNIAYRGWVDGL